MKSKFSSVFLGVCMLALLSPAAHAHTFGAHGAGFVSGIAHPFLGLDHLLAMVAVGIWAAQLGGASTWLAPLAFVSVMTGAAALGAMGLEMPALEPAIAASVLVLGLLVAFAVRVNVVYSTALVGLFAFFHGFAHGLELPQAASPILYFAGFIVATAALHGVGLGLGLSSRRVELATRLGGSLIAMAGLYLLSA